MLSTYCGATSCNPIGFFSVITYMKLSACIVSGLPKGVNMWGRRMGGGTTTNL